MFRVEAEHKANEERTRAFLLEHYSLVMPIRVCQIVVEAEVEANRASETNFNTPEHRSYVELEASCRAAARRHHACMQPPDAAAFLSPWTVWR